MDKMLYVAMTGASQNTLAQRAHANNLANVSTNGFQRDLEQARSMPLFGQVHPSRVYAMSERPGTDFSPGSLQETGNELDVAVEGDGWLAVQAPDGGEAYVRSASLKVDALGMLRTGSGLPVIGNGGPGTISIRALGEGPSVIAEVDRLKLVRPDPAQLEKQTDGMIHFKGTGQVQADANVQVSSGFLQASNVNAVEEMTAILSLSRQFELHVKMMRTAEDNDTAMARVLQIS